MWGEANGTLLQYSCLESPMDGGAWWAAVHGVSKSRAQLSDLSFTFHFHALEKAMAPHSSVLAWRIPGMGEPGGLPSMGSHRVGHDGSDLAAEAAWPCESVLERLLDLGLALQETYLCLPYRIIKEWHNRDPGPLAHKAPLCLLHEGQGSRLTHDSGLGRQSRPRFSALALPLARCLQHHMCKAADTPVTWVYFLKCWDNGVGVNGD